MPQINIHKQEESFPNPPDGENLPRVSRTVEITADVAEPEQLANWLELHSQSIEAIDVDACRIVTELDFIPLSQAIWDNMGDVGCVALRYPENKVRLVWKPGISRVSIWGETKGGVSVPGTVTPLGDIAHRLANDILTGEHSADAATPTSAPVGGDAKDNDATD